MVIEREVFRKVSNLCGCGIFLPGVGWKPCEDSNFKGEESSDSCSPCISADLPSNGMLGC